LRICEKTGIQVIETSVKEENLNQYEAVFLTGTSPEVLPVSSIDAVVYKTDIPLLKGLKDQYNQLIENYLQAKR
jgi:branched-chain amino acid aminotransferase